MSNETHDEGHYLNLRGAQLVSTDDLMTTHDQLRDVLNARAMACVHGDAGTGKTVAVGAALRVLAPQSTCRIQFRSRPSPRDIRHELFRTLALPGQAPPRPVEFDAMLKETLRAPFRVLVCDEAQQLSRECFEYWRYLWDDTDTDIAIVFVGGGDCYRVLRREPMLSSRIYTWQQYKPMTRERVRRVIPAFHPLWSAASMSDIDYVDKHAAHGNFRSWARVTQHCLDGLSRLGRNYVDRDLLQWVFSRIAGRSK